MPREIVLGNGELLVNLDRHLYIRDIYYPYVGWANHVGGHRCRVGVWTEGGAFAWLDDPAWQWQVGYEADTLVTDCMALHLGLGLRLRVSQAVLHDRNILAQRFRIENKHGKAREVRLFFAHDLRIDESDIGDTAFYYPQANALVHYKRDRYFLFGGQVGEGVPEDGAGMTQYACGEKGFRGAEGTWRDAEDGQLSRNAIAQGAVDSVVGYALLLPANGEGVLRTWMAAGETLEQVTAMQTALLRRGFEEALTASAAHDGTYALRRSDLDKLPPRVAELFTRSLLIIRTQMRQAGGDSGVQRQRHHGDRPRPLFLYVAPRRRAGIVCAGPGGAGRDHAAFFRVLRPGSAQRPGRADAQVRAGRHRRGVLASLVYWRATGRRFRFRRTARHWSSGRSGSISQSTGTVSLPPRFTAS